jgi:hypothetical protein
MAEPLMPGTGSAMPSDENVVEVTYRADESGQMHPDTADQSTGCCSRCNEKCLDVVVGIVIFLNVVIMGIELDYPWRGFKVVEQLMLVVYCIDVLLRMKWAGLKTFAQIGAI